MKLLPTIALVTFTCLGFVLNYFLVVVPEQRDRREMRQVVDALTRGDRAEARLILTGDTKTYFQTIAQELGK